MAKERIWVTLVISILCSFSLFGKEFKVKGTPNMDIYYCLGVSKSYMLDVEALVCQGHLLGSTDSLGIGRIEVKSLHLNKVSTILFAVKSGYKPMIMPDRLQVMDGKKENYIPLLEKDSISCSEYYKLASDVDDIDSKREGLLHAIMGDYQDKEGIKSLALVDYAIILTGNEKSFEALLFRNKVKLNKDDDLMVSKYDWLRNEENTRKLKVQAENITKANKEKRWQNTKAVLTGLAQGMQSVASSVSVPVNDANSPPIESVDKSSNIKSNSAKSTSTSEVIFKNQDSNVYADWETQLIKMNTYYERDYKSSTRLEIQSKMKSIRQKWENRGYKMSKSEWEDWDGQKR